MEIEIVETKLQRLEHAETVIMLYNRKIEDIERNLHNVGWWERRKMQKEISAEEQKRDSYEAETTKKYGAKPKLKDEIVKLLKEKKRIEDSTGVTASREREQQQKRSKVVPQRQEHHSHIADWKAKQSENRTKYKHFSSL